MDGYVKEDTDFKIGDLVIHKGAGREMWLVLEIQWVMCSADNRMGRELVLMDCATNKTKTSLARFYCKYLAS
jgi:hypothetical protein